MDHHHDDFLLRGVPLDAATNAGLDSGSAGRAIAACYWLQLVSYFALVSAYDAVPVPQFVPDVDELGEQLGRWRAGLDFDTVIGYGYWVGRAWPGTRVLVFAMGCLAALNRLDASKAQAVLDAEAGTSAGDKSSGGDDPRSTPSCGEAFECCECCKRNCRRRCPTVGCLGQSTALPALITDRANEGSIRNQWAWQADFAAFMYVAVVAVTITVERVVFGQIALGTGRVVLEGIFPLLELALIVSLTYDGGTSYTARFCNLRLVHWFGNLSMCFYMIHMMAVFVLPGVQVAFTIASRGPTTCEENYSPGDGGLACYNLGFPSVDNQYWIGVSLAASLGPEAGCAAAGVGPDTGVWPTCPVLADGARYGQACVFSGTVEGGDDTCLPDETPEVATQFCSITAAMSCIYGTSAEDFPPENIGDGPEDLLTVPEFCERCNEAWSLMFPMLEGFMIPVAFALAVLAGWLLMRWVELPAQTWIRGDAWAWTHSVTCFPACCSFTLDCMPAWLPSCLPWECCPCIFILCCGCFGACFKDCRKSGDAEVGAGRRRPSRQAYEPLPPTKP